MLYQHRPHKALRQSPKRGASLRQGAEELGQERNFDRSLSTEGVGAAMSVEGATDGVAFETYIEHFLAPTLKDGQVVVMDNLQVHKSRRVKEIIEGAGAEVLFLPPYSPDFSPIEETFSKVKGILRRVGARTREALVEATGHALDAVSRRDAVGWFGHCGYDIAHQSL